MKKIADIIQFIELNLSAPLTVEEIAAEAGFSVFHFQRMFSSLLGLPVGTYLLQRRLMKAAFALNETRTDLIQIAQAAGYSSQEAFTRAFKRAFGLTPARYRKEGRRPVLRALPALDKDFVSHLHRHPELAHPRFVDAPARSLIGLTRKIERAQATPMIQALWREMKGYAPAFTPLQKPQSPFYGILLEGGAKTDGPDYDAFHYCAAVEATAQTPPPQGMEKIERAPCHYAVFTHSGKTEDLPLTNAFIWGIWLTQNDRHVAPAPDMEVYSTFPDAPAGLEIWIPVQTK